MGTSRDGYEISTEFTSAVAHRLDREEIPGVDDLAELQTSPRDGEPFVILWGVDYNRLPPHGIDPFTVAAYEKTGVAGQRYVLRFPRQVVLWSDEQLKRAVFPPGHKVPN